MPIVAATGDLRRSIYLAQPTSHLRLRLASSPADITTPDGVAADGEVEDYRLVLPPPQADLAGLIIPTFPVSGSLQSH